MPSFRVTSAEFTVGLFDAVGSSAEAKPEFISHVGLVSTSGIISRNECPVVDMGPPLHGPDHVSRLPVRVAGTAELTVDERRKIKLFAELHASEHASLRTLGIGRLLALAPQMYCIAPHSDLLTEADGRPIRTRFSCAGFVLEAYRSARIDLLDTDALPLIPMSAISEAYPEQFRLAQSGRIKLAELGLVGDGPWPVLLCSYLFHSLARETSEIRSERFVAQLKHHCF